MAPLKPLLLDLFCGAGGAAMGYSRAGFDIFGVDNHPQPRYPFPLIQKDALVFLRQMVTFKTEWPWVAIHTSPPCQRYTVLRHAAKHKGASSPDLVDEVRALLKLTELPYVIENVPHSPTEHLIVLCGSMFGLGSNGRQLRRHRNFETSFPIMSPPCMHDGEAIGVYGGGPKRRHLFGYEGRGGYQGTTAEKSEAMGIDWMNRDELAQAIPPAYTEYIGGTLMGIITQNR